MSTTHPSGQTTGTASDGSGQSINFAGVDASAGNFNKSRDNLSVPLLASSPPGSSPFNSTEANGNKITFSNSNGTYTDTLGQTALSKRSGSESSDLCFIPPANETTGTRVSVTVTFVNFTVQTNFNPRTVTATPSPSTVQLPRSLWWTTLRCQMERSTISI